MEWFDKYDIYGFTATICSIVVGIAENINPLIQILTLIATLGLVIFSALHKYEQWKEKKDKRKKDE